MEVALDLKSEKGERERTSRGDVMFTDLTPLENKVLDIVGEVSLNGVAFYKDAILRANGEIRVTTNGIYRQLMGWRKTYDVHGS